MADEASYDAGGSSTHDIAIHFLSQTSPSSFESSCSRQYCARLPLAHHTPCLSGPDGFWRTHMTQLTGPSKPLSLAKEGQETGYWLRVHREAQSHNQHERAHLLKACDGLLRMLNSIILTTRRKLASGIDSDPKSRTQNSELRTSLRLRSHDLC